MLLQILYINSEELTLWLQDDPDRKDWQFFILHIQDDRFCLKATCHVPFEKAP